MNHSSLSREQRQREAIDRNLRMPAADGQIRDSIRVFNGPQAYRHNHYSADQFYQYQPGEGIITNLYGQRIVCVSEHFITALLTTLEEELGDAGREVMYQIGYQWGVEDMKSYSQRAQQEFEVEFEKMSMGTMLETWWWPLNIEGWGTWHYDFRQGKQGIIFVDLYESAVAQSLGNVGKVVCYFYAGLFAAVFSKLAKQELGCIEIQCYSTGEDYCKFLISTKKRINTAAFWRNEGATSKDILRKLSQSS